VSDFHQNGVITTFHNLRTRSIEQQEEEVRAYAKQRPVTLVLPSLYSELQSQALERIVQILGELDYLDQIVVGIDRANEQEYCHALEFFSGLPQQTSVLWNDGPRLRKIDGLLESNNLSPKQAGKGRNVWYMLGFVLAMERAQVIAVHDCDITTYNREMLTRLIYPVVHPGLDFKYSKGFYSRVASRKMNGRVCRLLITPLLRALQKVCGQSEYLAYMDSFKYALSGEFAFQQDILRDIRIPSDWGLEMGMLSEIYRNQSANKVCQVDISDFYDHKHQTMSFEDASRGLSKMSVDISKSMFRKMATFGEVFSEERIRTIKAAYYRLALDLVDAYESDAIMNGLEYDRHSELKAIEMFAQNIMCAGHEFLKHSADVPFIPSWKRVVSAVPDIFEQMREAVEDDFSEFSSGDHGMSALPMLEQQVGGHLRAVYGESVEVESLSEEVLAAAGLEGSRFMDLRGRSSWSEQDVVLISYGDSICKEGEAPLQTLYRFVRNHMSRTVSAVHLLPFYPDSSDDGFSVIDYMHVKEQLGSWEDVEALGETVELMADLVVNHCSAESEWFTNFLEDREPGRGYFIEPDEGFDVSEVVRPRASELVQTFEDGSGASRQVWCTFSRDQVDLNYANPAVLLEMCRLLRFYVERGVRFFRLDAVAFLWKESGTSCVHLSQTHELVKLFRLLLEHLNPEAVVITETNVPNKENLSYFGNDNEAHLIYNFSLPPLLVYTLLSGDSTYLKSWMMSMPPARYGRSYFNFIASHDGIGVRPIEGLLDEAEQTAMLDTLRSFGGHISYRKKPDGTESAYEANISLFDAFKGTIEGGEDARQVDRMVCAHTILLALEGIPGIYIHSFLGTENDEALVEETGRPRSINRHQWQEREVRDILGSEEHPKKRLFDELSRRVEIRRKQEAFHPNATQLTLHFGQEIFAFWRESANRNQCVFVLNNISDAVQEVSLLELNLVGTEPWHDLLTGRTFPDAAEMLELQPYESVWISN
tara:strand:- start:1244 stop:4213 length:2970 start_codon:yes stop_codon:yes gene_type:complete